MKNLPHIETPVGWVEIPTRAQLVRWNRHLFTSQLVAWGVAAFFALMFLIGCATGWKF